MSTMGTPRETDFILMALWRSSSMSRVSLFILAFSGAIVGLGGVGCGLRISDCSGTIGSGSRAAPVTNWSSFAICWAVLGFGGMVVLFPL